MGLLFSKNIKNSKSEGEVIMYEVQDSIASDIFIPLILLISSGILLTFSIILNPIFFIPFMLSGGALFIIIDVAIDSIKSRRIKQSVENTKQLTEHIEQYPEHVEYKEFQDVMIRDKLKIYIKELNDCLYAHHSIREKFLGHKNKNWNSFYEKNKTFLKEFEDEEVIQVRKDGVLETTEVMTNSLIVSDDGTIKWNEEIGCE